MDSIEKSFKAQLLCVTPGFRARVSVTTSGGIAKQGWLVLGSSSESAVTFSFEYLDRTEDRILYAVRAAEGSDTYAGAPLDVSVNGYVGLYPSAHEAVTWRLEVTRQDGDSRPVRCRLRDAHGQRIAILSKTVRTGSRGDAYIANASRIDYLNVKDGVIAEFEIKYQD